MSPPTWRRRPVQAVAIAARAGKVLAVPGLGAHFEEQHRRRDPFHLHAVLRQLAAEERLVNERLVDEIPRVCVDLVEIANSREEAPALDDEALRQRDRPEVRLLDADFVVTVDRGREVAEEIRIDVGGEREFGFAEIEVALPGTDFSPAGRNPGDVVIGRVLRQVRVVPGQDHRNGGVELDDALPWP